MCYRNLTTRDLPVNSLSKQRINMSGRFKPTREFETIIMARHWNVIDVLILTPLVVKNVNNLNNKRKMI